MATQPEPYVRSFTLDSVPTINSRGEVQHIGRYDGINNKTEHWDHLRRDEELWFQDADCLVHFYAANTSRRGPSLRIPLKIVEQTKSRFLLEQCLHRPAPASPITSEDDNSDSGYSGSVNGCQHGCFELHIPSPALPTRQQAHSFHLTTRNFFAFLLGVPLVGSTLGTALTQLRHRLQLWQVDGTCDSKFHTYCEEQGYRNYVENPDYAAASLYCAEQTKAREMWSETFTHCVGMHERLVHSEDYAQLCDETKDMLARSAIAMKAHVVGVTESLGTFLEEDLGPEKLGLSKQLRDHLDRFRSTLHLFYVHEINGYFPPDANDPWGKRLWHGMYNDFHSLYVYLADTKSTDEHASILGSQGGLCVAQNLNAFDHRHGFAALPYTMPLLPEHQKSRQSWTAGPRRTFGSLRVSRSNNTNGPQKSSPRQALSKASNQSDSSVTSNRLVQEYIRFENLKDEEKVPATEARKVRWILVYSVLQLLISITKAPAEVRHTQGTTYPLCVLDPACPVWPGDHLTIPRPEQHAAQYLAAVEEVRKSFEEDRISIHPDCEASCAADYFSMNSLPRNDPSPPSATAAVPPLRRSLTLSRTASIRSSVSTLHRSVVGSLARRNSSRRNSILAPSTKSPTQGTFCETLHELQGSEVGESSPVDSIMNTDSKFDEAKALPLEQPRSKWTDAPALEMQQLSLTEPAVPMRKLRHTNGMRRHKRIRSRSGPVNCGSSLSEEALATNAPVDLPQKLASDLSTFAGFQFDFDIPQKTAEPERQKSSIPQAVYHESTPGKWANINVGCYQPTGQFTRKNRVASDTSLASIASNTSSNYPEDSLQADDIEEEDVRGRGRVRGLGRRQHLALVHVT